MAFSPFSQQARAQDAAYAAGLRAKRAARKAAEKDDTTTKTTPAVSTPTTSTTTPTQPSTQGGRGAGNPFSQQSRAQDAAYAAGLRAKRVARKKAAAQKVIDDAAKKAADAAAKKAAAAAARKAAENAAAAATQPLTQGGRGAEDVVVEATQPSTQGGRGAGNPFSQQSRAQDAAYAAGLRARRAARRAAAAQKVIDDAAAAKKAADDAAVAQKAADDAAMETETPAEEVEVSAPTSTGLRGAGNPFSQQSRAQDAAYAAGLRARRERERLEEVVSSTEEIEAEVDDFNKEVAAYKADPSSFGTIKAGEETSRLHKLRVAEANLKRKLALARSRAADELRVSTALKGIDTSSEVQAEFVEGLQSDDVEVRQAAARDISTLVNEDRTRRVGEFQEARGKLFQEISGQGYGKNKALELTNQLSSGDSVEIAKAKETLNERQAGRVNKAYNDGGYTNLFSPEAIDRASRIYVEEGALESNQYLASRADEFGVTATVLTRPPGEEALEYEFSRTFPQHTPVVDGGFGEPSEESVDTSVSDWVATLRKLGYSQGEIDERLRVLSTVGPEEYNKTTVAKTPPLSSLYEETELAPGEFITERAGSSRVIAPGYGSTIELTPGEFASPGFAFGNIHQGTISTALAPLPPTYPVEVAPGEVVDSKEPVYVEGRGLVTNPEELEKLAKEVDEVAPGEFVPKYPSLQPVPEKTADQFVPISDGKGIIAFLDTKTGDTVHPNPLFIAEVLTPYGTYRSGQERGWLHPLTLASGAGDLTLFLSPVIKGGTAVANLGIKGANPLLVKGAAAWNKIEGIEEIAFKPISQIRLAGAVADPVGAGVTATIKGTKSGISSTVHGAADYLGDIGDLRHGANLPKTVQEFQKQTYGFIPFTSSTGGSVGAQLLRQQARIVQEIAEATDPRVIARLGKELDRLEDLFTAQSKIGGGNYPKTFGVKTRPTNIGGGSGTQALTATEDLTSTIAKTTLPPLSGGKGGTSFLLPKIPTFPESEVSARTFLEPQDGSTVASSGPASSRVFGFQGGLSRSRSTLSDISTAPSSASADATFTPTPEKEIFVPPTDFPEADEQEVRIPPVRIPSIPGIVVIPEVTPVVVPDEVVVPGTIIIPTVIPGVTPIGTPEVIPTVIPEIISGVVVEPEVIPTVTPDEEVFPKKEEEEEVVIPPIVIPIVTPPIVIPEVVPPVVIPEVVPPVVIPAEVVIPEKIIIEEIVPKEIIPPVVIPEEIIIEPIITSVVEVEPEPIVSAEAKAEEEKTKTKKPPADTTFSLRKGRPKKGRRGGSEREDGGKASTVTRARRWWTIRKEEAGYVLYIRTKRNRIPQGVFETYAEAEAEGESLNLPRWPLGAKEPKVGNPAGTYNSTVNMRKEIN